MTSDRDAYREVYRSTREGLALLDNLLTEPERDAILREATRTARNKENFWLAVTALGGGAIYFVFDAMSSINHLKAFALVGYFVAYLLITTVRRRRSRIRLIAKEVMAILKRKQIRPPYCLGCGLRLMDDGSHKCVDCGCDLAEKTRHVL